MTIREKIEAMVEAKKDEIRFRVENRVGEILNEEGDDLVERLTEGNILYLDDEIHSTIESTIDDMVEDEVRTIIDFDLDEFIKDEVSDMVNDKVIFFVHDAVRDILSE